MFFNELYLYLIKYKNEGNKMKYLILLSSMFFNPCFAGETRYRFRGMNELASGWAVENEKLRRYIDYAFEAGYSFSVPVIKEDGQIIITEMGKLVLPGSVAGKGMTREEQNAIQEMRGKMIILNGYYTPPVTTWSDLIKMSPDWVLGLVESGEMGDQIPLPYHNLMERKAMMQAGEDEPGNGGGSPSASMKFYFALPEEITPEQVKQIQEHLAKEGGAFIMFPFHGYNMKGYLEDEVTSFEKKRTLKEEAFVNYWGIVPNEGVQNELMQRLLEQAGLAEEGDDFDNSLSAYSQGTVPDVGVGFMFQFLKSYLKAGMAYKDYDKGVRFMIGIPQSSFREKAGAFYEGYGDMEEPIFQKGMRGWSLPDYGTGLSSGYQIGFSR